ncbi:hypothetical protein MMC13_002403 [Lambiella insularis]|nr:hypothetical protein [Lambiella insularis]
MAFSTSSTRGILHHFSPRLVAFEYDPSSQEPASPAQLHTLLFIPGLSDGLCTVSYVTAIVKALPSNWRLVQPLLSSSYTGWGTYSLDTDVQELVQCISFILSVRPKGKIVLMGHSTGCQDIMHYLLSPLQTGEAARPRLAGAILQAGVSDRQFLEVLYSKDVYESSVKLAQSYVDEGRSEDVLPTSSTGAFFQAPVSARRWLSLASPPPAHDGQDDYFSSDFTDERLKQTFGRIGITGTPVQILYGDKDQYVPDSVDKARLVERWERHIRQGKGVVDEESGIVEGASHSLDDASVEVVGKMVRRVVGFLCRIETGSKFK